MHRSVAKQCIDVGAINSTLLQGLLQFTSYQISVQAMTNAGVGPASAGVFASTLEGGIKTDLISFMSSIKY